jgi:hypothetical protein
MIFKVSEKLKGSCVLPTLKKAIWANMTLSIAGNDLRADDIRGVIKKGILVPVNDDLDPEMIDKDQDVIIINNTNRVLVLGEIALRPSGSLPISKVHVDMPAIKSAAEDNLITILSDEDDESHTEIKKSAKKIAKKKEKIVEDFVTPETGEDKDVTPTAWNFRTKELEEAKKVPKIEEFIEVTSDDEPIDFIDGEAEDAKPVPKKKKAKKKAKKKTAKKKTAKKKTTKKKTKKKEIKAKTKKVKTIEPVGDQKPSKTSFEAAIELDSRGNPIEKASDTLKHLIDSINSPDDVPFVDNEQAQKRYEDRTDMD